MERVECLDGLCFSVTPYDDVSTIICIDVKSCMLADEMEYMDGWFSNETVIWKGAIPYHPIKAVPETTPAAVDITYEEMLLCTNSYTCFNPKGIVTNETEAKEFEKVECVFEFCIVVEPASSETDMVFCLTDME